ncbi:DUF2637 domain-containing protein [Streptomyces sp. NPDC059455]|uniref:DUF2637 domain-containing protein n=1 Tax=Streptomyces sp. NPDC059455 TaxID=3346837 RepID=UPI003697AD98
MKLPFSRACEGSRSTNGLDVPPLSRWERWGAGLTAIGGAAVGGLGFYASFDAVSAAAASWDFDEPWVLPTAIDSAIPMFTGANLFLIRMGMPLAWVRLVPWFLSLITCALNVAAGHSLGAKVAHGATSLLWVGVSEIAAHIYAVRIGAVTGRRRRMDTIRWARWYLSPLPTFLLWRRMKLWELSSYDEVLELEQERLVYRAQLQSRFGRMWRRKAPVESLLPLQLVRAGIPLAETAPTGLRAAGIEPMGILLPLAAPAEVPDVLAAAPAPKAPVVKRRESMNVPKWSTEDELYEIIKRAIDTGSREAFNGPLTGAEIAHVLGQSDGNGRKVRARLMKTYAEEKGVSLPQGATVDDVFAAFGRALTQAVSGSTGG